MDNGIEKELLKELSKRLVMSKFEIVRFFEGRTENPIAMAEDVLKSLLQKGYVTNSTPLGSVCFAITKKGIKASEE